MNWELLFVILISLQVLVAAWWLFGDSWVDRQFAKAMERTIAEGEAKFQLWLVESRRVHKERMAQLAEYRKE